MNIAVICAMPMELSPWCDRHGFRAVAALGGEQDVREATIGRSRVRVVVCGVAAPRAAASVGPAADDGADALIVAGFGGGLRPALRAGEIVVAQRAEYTGRDTRGASAEGVPAVACDARLVALAAACGATVVESLVTIDHVAFSVEEKSRLGAGHDVVDMETALLLAQARALGVPAVAIRVIGDPVEEPVPFELQLAMGPDHIVRPGRFVFEAARRPWRWAALARVFRTHDRARHQLAAFLDRFVGALDSGGGP